MDARMAQLIRALQAQRKGVNAGANLNGMGGRALPFSQGVTAPLGIGGYWSSPISFGLGGGAGAAGLAGIGNASLGVGAGAVGAATDSGAGIGGTLPTDATPSPGLGASDSSPHYQSDPSAAPQPSPYIGPSSPSAGALPSIGSVTPSVPNPGSNAHYGGMNLGDPTDPFNYRYLYQNSFGG